MTMNENKQDTVINVFFAGTGGQGVLKAAEVCGWAAILEGYHAKKSEVHGMAQRGGSVESHVRFGGEVFSPLIPRGTADFLVSFDKGEHDRLLPFMKKDGCDLIEALTDAEQNLNDRRYLNTYLLGVLSKHLSITVESWLKALALVFPEKSRAMNREVFLKARGAAK